MIRSMLLWWWIKLGCNCRSYVSHSCWLQNSAPSEHHKDKSDVKPKYPQTVERVHAYDLTVCHMMQKDQQQQQWLLLRDHMTTIDVWQASLREQYADNMYLSKDWNHALGMFFVKLATKAAASWWGCMAWIKKSALAMEVGPSRVKKYTQQQKNRVGGPLFIWTIY